MACSHYRIQALIFPLTVNAKLELAFVNCSKTRSESVPRAQWCFKDPGKISSWLSVRLCRRLNKATQQAAACESKLDWERNDMQHDNKCSVATKKKKNALLVFCRHPFWKTDQRMVSRHVPCHFSHLFSRCSPPPPVTDKSCSVQTTRGPWCVVMCYV